MSVSFLGSTLDIPPASSISNISSNRCMRDTHESARLVPSTSYGYFWDVEELRHQEHLHRVSHAQHLYRHCHDSNEAARVYRSFMDEQNQWMDEQERMKEIEARLSARAYQQRASRWEEEWMGLQEGRNVEDILKFQGTGAIMLTAPIKRGLEEISFGSNDENELSDITMTPQTISSLHLPEPLLSIPGSCSRPVFSGDSIQQVDGAQPSKDRNHKPARNGSSPINLGTQPDDNHTTDGTNCVPGTSQDGPTKIIKSNPHFSPHKIRYSSRLPGNFHQLGPQSPPSGKPKKKKSLIRAVEAASPSLSSNSSRRNSSPVIFSRPQGEHGQHRGPSLTAGEVLRVIAHKPRAVSLQYLIHWKPLDSGVPGELWVRAIDFVESGKMAILEEYHFHHSLGPVRWPRDPRRQSRSSTSFGVQELKSALDERRQMLLDRGVDESEASCEMNQERWKMRDEWQRAGRGWGSAIAIVKDRKKAWLEADSDAGESQSMAAAKVRDTLSLKKSPASSSSDHMAMMKAAGMLDPGTDRGILEQGPSDSKKNPRYKLTPPLDIPKPGYLNRSENLGKEAIMRNQFAFTSEDEREWREIFGPELVRSASLEAKTQSSRLSRVKSTLHDLPNRLNLELVRASTLPELHERVTKFQAPLGEIPQGTEQLSGPRSLRSTSSTLSEAQSHLKEQRKNLIARLLSHGPFKRESRTRPRIMNTLGHHHHLAIQPTDGSQLRVTFPETATEPLGSADNQPGNQPIAMRGSSSYISFDGAHSTARPPTRESWTKKMWDRFSHLLVSSSRASSLKSGPRKRTEAQIPISTPLLQGKETQALPPNAREVTGSCIRDTAETAEADSASTPGETVARNNYLHDESPRFKIQPVKSQRDLIRIMSPRPPESAVVETPASRTASWAASVSPISHKRKSGEPQEVKRAPSPDDEKKNIVEMPPVPPRAGTKTIRETTIFSQVPLQASGRAGIPLDLSHSKGAKSVSTQSEFLTRTRSQQQYLADREAERQTRRDRNILKAKARAKTMKEKADRQAVQFKRLNMLHSKKACLLGKWDKRDQLELELLRMQLGLRGAKNSWKKSDLRRLGLSDLQELRESLLPTAKVASKQPKRQSTFRSMG